MLLLPTNLASLWRFGLDKPLSVLMVRQEPSRFEPRWLLLKEGLTLSYDLNYCCQDSWRFGLTKPLSVLMVRHEPLRFEPGRLLLKEGLTLSYDLSYCYQA